MEFNNRLYELRKQKGISQEELAGKLNVSRQTVSKWELGESTPDMEKLVAMSDFFEISLDELVLGKEPAMANEQNPRAGFPSNIKPVTFSESTKRNIKKGLKIAAIFFGVLVVIDVISAIIYFSLQ